MNESKKFYAIQRYENSADIFIFGDIAEDVWWGDEVTPNSIVNQIKELDVSEINIHINSYGGSVSAGWAIYSALRESKAKIISYADGFVCSAANYPFLAGDERHASAVSAFYLHNVSTFASGYSEDLRKAAEEIDKLTEIGINAFTERAGMSRDTVKQLMDAETWLTPEEAVAYGIATDVLSEADNKRSQSAAPAIMQLLFKAKEEKEPEPEQTVSEPEPTEENIENPAQSVEEPAADIQPVSGLMKTLAGFYNAKI